MQYNNFLAHSVIFRSRALQTVSILYNSEEISKDLKPGGAEVAEEEIRVWICWILDIWERFGHVVGIGKWAEIK